MSREETNLRVGLCGIGLDAYWPQFEGLRERLEGYVHRVRERLEKAGATVENLGLVDTPQRGRDAGHACRRSDVDLLIIYVTTYALSTTVLPMVQRAGVPVLVLNLQPEAAIDYEAFNRLPDRTAMTGEWLAFCSACPVPEIANVLSRAGIGFHQVTGVLGDEAVWADIEDWIAAARVKKALAENRMGLMGHYYSGMLDIQTDLTQVAITFGSHIEHLEVDELTWLREDLSDEKIRVRVEDFREHFDVQPDCSSEELARAARTSVALDRFAAAHDLQSLAYYYMGSGVAANEDTISSIILGTSLLTARGIAVAGEYEVKTLSRDGKVHCLRVKTGDLVWKRDLQADQNAKLPECGFAGSPLRVDDRVVVSVGATGTALDALTGETRWQSGPAIAGYAAPVRTGQEKNASRLLFFAFKELASVAPADGNSQWALPWPTQYGANVADPIVMGDTVFISSAYGRGCALVDLASGRVLWQNKAVRSQCSPLVLHEGSLFGFDGFIDYAALGQALVCLNPANGEVRWRKGGIAGQLIRADDRLLLMLITGELVVIKASSTGYEELARARVCQPERCPLPPALANGRLYVRTGAGLLLCLNLAP